MKILMIGTFDTKGGAAKVSWALKRAYERAGHTVTMFVHRKHSDDEFVFQIPQTRGQQILATLCATDLHFWKTNYILDTPQFKEADIVHLHNIHGNFFNHATFEKMTRLKPVVWTFHDMWALTGHNAWGYESFIDTTSSIPQIETTPHLRWDNKRFLYKTKQKMSKAPFTVVTPSKWLAQEARRGVLKDHRIETIHNGVDTTIFKPTDQTEARTKLSLPLDKKIVLTVAQGGLGNPQKGGAYVDELQRRFQNDKNIAFIAIGSKDTYIKDPAQLALYYSAADVLLFTSLAENFPLVVLEAMACGLPIVSFDVGGVKEAVAHGEHGYIARYKDVDDAYAGLNEILKLDTDAAFGMRTSCRERAQKKFDVGMMADMYLKLYNSLLQ
ncbi:MAG: glycosyltransferase [Candidatus Pacebacteria bacterium]|nr:glycosyltransferase [Candidatus Paceibacterota bacterium]